MTIAIPVYTELCDIPLGSESGGSNGLSGGEIAAIVVAILVALLLFLLVVVVVIVISNMWFRKVRKIGPPPSRAGSKRFVS